MNSPETLDWTDGHPAICAEICHDCAHRWYFRRGFCPACGSRQIKRAPLQPYGVVYALTSVNRAPSSEWRELAPYDIALIDLADGVRVMTHAQAGLRIGDAVQVTYVHINERLIPKAVPASSPVSN